MTAYFDSNHIKTHVALIFNEKTQCPETPVKSILPEDAQKNIFSSGSPYCDPIFLFCFWLLTISTN
jgi:hypothetical protein